MMSAQLCPVRRGTGDKSFSLVVMELPAKVTGTSHAWLPDSKHFCWNSPWNNNVHTFDLPLSSDCGQLCLNGRWKNHVRTFLLPPPPPTLCPYLWPMKEQCLLFYCYFLTSPISLRHLHLPLPLPPPPSPFVYIKLHEVLHEIVWCSEIHSGHRMWNLSLSSYLTLLDIMKWNTAFFWANSTKQKTLYAFSLGRFKSTLAKLNSCDPDRVSPELRKRCGCKSVFEESSYAQLPRPPPPCSTPPPLPPPPFPTHTPISGACGEVFVRGSVQFLCGKWTSVRVGVFILVLGGCFLFFGVFFWFWFCVVCFCGGGPVHPQ